MLPVRTARDFGNLNARVEADESGIAARVETRLSARARHLFLLGVHCGMFAEALENTAVVSANRQAATAPSSTA